MSPVLSSGARRFVPAAVVVAALAGVGGAALIKPAPTPASAGRPAATTLIRQVAISSAIRACPPGANSGQNRVALFAAAPSTSGATASSGAAPARAAPAGAASSGTAGLAPLPQSGNNAAHGSAGANPASETAPDSLSLPQIPATGAANRQQAWSVTASGAMAQGVEAEVGDGSGLTDVRCGEPGSSIWFIGPGQSAGAGQIQLDLMNVDALAATVNLSVITDAGAAQSGGITGITVPPHSLVTQSLSAQANGASAVAINVRTSAGRVAAALSESTTHGVFSWVPSTVAPATSLVVPGVPPSSTSGSLFLVVPGSANAKVSVAAIGSQGRYQPFGSQTINLPGQSASDVQLTPVGGSAAALQITSNVPVTAEVQVPGVQNTGLGTFTAAAAPVTEQAVIAGNSDSGGDAAEVALSAPGATVNVRLTEIAEGAPSAPAGGTGQMVTVQAGHTVIFQAKEPAGARRDTPFTIVIGPQPGSGPLYAARIETQGQNTVSVITAVSALTTIGLPPVRQSYTAIWP